MQKHQLDELYHLLRLASCTDEPRIRQDDGLTPAEQRFVLFGMCRHLLAGGDYPSLLRFSRMYGLRHLLEPTISALRDALDNCSISVGRVVEFGSGLGWLGHGLADHLGLKSVLVDKRPWVGTIILADLETQAGRERVLEQMEATDIIVMSDFLHCVTNPKYLIRYFRDWPIVALEYMPKSEEMLSSFNRQLLRYGGNPLTRSELADAFRPRKFVCSDELDPYIRVIALREE